MPQRPVSFLGREDRTLEERLRAEAEGILAWIVRGCMEWQEVGLKPPRIVLQATEEYRRENDPLADWIDERCVIDPRATTAFSLLYEDYRNWAEEAGIAPISQRSFAAHLDEKGFEKVRLPRNAKGRRGIGLRAQP